MQEALGTITPLPREPKCHSTKYQNLVSKVTSPTIWRPNGHTTYRPTPGVNTGTITHPVDTLLHTPTLSFGDIHAKISEFLTTHRPTMRDLVANAHDVPSLLPSWKPKSEDNELAMHISKLSIPTTSGGRPKEKDNLDKARIARVPAITCQMVGSRFHVYVVRAVH